MLLKALFTAMQIVLGVVGDAKQIEQEVWAKQMGNQKSYRLRRKRQENCTLKSTLSAKV
jgi:hypothetical protein